MSVEIKFCGLTRAADARFGVALGAAYLGFIFAPSARRVTVEDARVLLSALDDDEGSLESEAVVSAASHQSMREATAGENRRGARRVGVFAGVTSDEILRTAETLSLDVIQLHGTGDVTLVRTLRASTAARIWTVVHVGADGANAAQLAEAAHGDGLLLDAKVDGMLGGTGRSFDWMSVRHQVEPFRTAGPVILAGGLRPDNVARAIVELAPDIVDVSSGVESSPGVKDPARMRAFADAVHGVEPE